MCNSWWILAGLDCWAEHGWNLSCYACHVLLLLTNIWHAIGPLREIMMSSNLEVSNITAYDACPTIFTGYRFGRGSLSKQLFWRASASMAWLRSTYGNIASRCHLLSAASVNLRTPVGCLFHEPGRIMATAVSQYRDLGHGTVFLLTFEPQTFQSKHSDANWRHFCLQCDCRFSALAALHDFTLYKCT